MPGLTAIAAWNLRGASEVARRPELQLTSINALYVAIATALIVHFVGWAAVKLALAAGIDLDHVLPAIVPRLPLLPNPYDIAARAAHGKYVSAGALMMVAIGAVLESLFVYYFFRAEGFDLALDGFDGFGQGWVYKNILRPARHGYTPFAYILTHPVQGAYGMGYEGIVGDVRQGVDGELKVITLIGPQAFVYELAAPQTQGFSARLRNHQRRWLGGIIVIEASSIRNVLIHNLPDEDINGEIQSP